MSRRNGNHLHKSVLDKLLPITDCYPAYMSTTVGSKAAEINAGRRRPQQEELRRAKTGIRSAVLAGSAGSSGNRYGSSRAQDAEPTTTTEAQATGRRVLIVSSKANIQNRPKGREDQAQFSAPNQRPPKPSEPPTSKKAPHQKKGGLVGQGRVNVILGRATCCPGGHGFFEVLRRHRNPKPFEP